MYLPLPTAKAFGLLATDSDLDPQRPITFAVIWSVVKYLATIFAARFVGDVPAGQLCFGMVQFTADCPTRCADEETLTRLGTKTANSASIPWATNGGGFGLTQDWLFEIRSFLPRIRKNTVDPISAGWSLNSTVFLTFERSSEARTLENYAKKLN